MEHGLWLIIFQINELLIHRHKHQISSTKYQISSNIQSLKFQTFGPWNLELGIYLLFGYWCLEFVPKN